MCKIWARKYSGLRFETLSRLCSVRGAVVERVLYLHVTLCNLHILVESIDCISSDRCHQFILSVLHSRDAHGLILKGWL